MPLKRSVFSFFVLGILGFGANPSAFAARTLEALQPLSYNAQASYTYGYVTLQNIGNTAQTVSVSGGMKWGVADLGCPGLYGTVTGQYMAGWIVRGVDAGVTLTSAGAVVSRPLGARHGTGVYGTGNGVNISENAGLVFVLPPAKSIFLGSGRYGSCSTGLAHLKLSIAEDRGVISANGHLFAGQMDGAGNPILAEMLSINFIINGGRPF